MWTLQKKYASPITLNKLALSSRQTTKVGGEESKIISKWKSWRQYDVQLVLFLLCVWDVRWTDIDFGGNTATLLPGVLQRWFGVWRVVFHPTSWKCEQSRLSVSSSDGDMRLQKLIAASHVPPVLQLPSVAQGLAPPPPAPTGWIHGGPECFWGCACVVWEPCPRFLWASRILHWLGAAVGAQRGS